MLVIKAIFAYSIKCIKMKKLVLSSISILVSLLASGQAIQDNFEGTGNITTWFGDDCGLEQPFTNPFQTGINLSSKVLKYDDIGGQYANVRFDAAANFNLLANKISFSYRRSINYYNSGISNLLSSNGTK